MHDVVHYDSTHLRLDSSDWALLSSSDRWTSLTLQSCQRKSKSLTPLATSSYYRQPVVTICTCHCSLPIQIFQCRQLHPAVRSLTTEAAKTLIQAFVSCHLDFCNSLLYGTSDNLLQKLQSVQNAIITRLITSARRRDHITHLLHHFH